MLIAGSIDNCQQPSLIIFTIGQEMYEGIQKMKDGTKNICCAVGTGMEGGLGGLRIRKET